MAYLVEHRLDLDAAVCDQAVMYGQLEALKWLRSRDSASPYEWSRHDMRAALRLGVPEPSGEVRAEIRGWLADNAPWFVAAAFA
jgi:hypothetical protein